VTNRLLHALEVSDSSATLYLSGRLAGSDAFPLRGVCRDIPVHVRTLRLDLHGVTALDEGAMDTIRALVRYWREVRNGNFRLAFACEHDIANVVEPEPEPAPPTVRRLDQLIGRSAALTGMFL
jgi:ABC-type transporter Mla MlaB component